MKPRIKLILFSYAMLCLAGGISIVSPDATALCETAMGGSAAELGHPELLCGCPIAALDYPDAIEVR